MERWIEYKGMFFNIRQHHRFSVRKVSKKALREGAIYCDPENQPTEKKPWVLTLDHTGVDIFPNKEAALKVARDMITGRYDVKEKA